MSPYDAGRLLDQLALEIRLNDPRAVSVGPPLDLPESKLGVRRHVAPVATDDRQQFDDRGAVARQQT